MKKIMMPYLLAYFFLFVSYFLVSFIMAVLLSFMHVSSFVYNILLIIMNYFFQILIQIMKLKIYIEIFLPYIESIKIIMIKNNLKKIYF